jgi:hypothetical protein
MKQEIEFEPFEPIPWTLDDLAHSGHHELAQFLELFRDRHMTAAEIKILFRTADRNHDN